MKINYLLDNVREYEIIMEVIDHMDILYKY